MRKINGYTRKQAGVIYRAVKEGKIEMEKPAISKLYDWADDFGIDYNGSINRIMHEVHIAIDAIFEGDYEKAQAYVNAFAAA